MSATVVTLVSPQASPDGNPGLTNEVSKDLDTEMTSPLTLDDCSATSSTSAQSTEMSSFYSAKLRQERINARTSREALIHSPAVLGTWRREPQPEPSITPPSSLTRTTTLPSPSHSFSERPPTSNRNRSPDIMGGSFSESRPNGHSSMAGEDAVPLSRVVPGPVWPSANQLKVAHTYGIRRADGTYTQLIRADELDSYDFERVPISQGPEGMIILPPPEQPRPEQRTGPEPIISSDVSPDLNTDIQSH
jgi:hypothetical protein